MIIIVTAKVKKEWKSRKLNKKQLKTYWHALYPQETDYVNTLTSQKKAIGTNGRS